MNIHAIQTGTVSVKERQRQGEGNSRVRLVNTLRDPRWTKPLPIYAWVIEHPEGIIVVDTGETARTAQPGYFPGWHPYFRFGLKMDVKPEEEIGPQLNAIGISPNDVRWVVMTHLHTDHAGGLYHFPKSEILVSRQEYEAASGLTGRLNGYLSNHWPSWFEPRLIDFAPNPVGPFPETFTLTRAGDVHLVSTPGHSAGHLSVILEGEVTHFFAGDTTYTERLLLDQIVDGVSPDLEAAQQTIERVLRFVQATPTVYLPSHDPRSVSRLNTRQITSAEPAAELHV